MYANEYITSEIIFLQNKLKLYFDWTLFWSVNKIFEKKQIMHLTLKSIFKQLFKISFSEYELRYVIKPRMLQTCYAFLLSYRSVLLQ